MNCHDCKTGDARLCAFEFWMFGIICFAAGATLAWLIAIDYVHGVACQPNKQPLELRQRCEASGKRFLTR